MTRVGALLFALAAGSAAHAGGPSGCHSKPAAPSHVVSAAAADWLRRAPGTTRGARTAEFILSDGRVLVQESAGDAGALFTAEAWKLRLRELDESRRFRRVGAGEAFHLLRSLIDDGDSFAAKVPELRAGLRRRLANEGLGPPGNDSVAKLGARWRAAECRLDPALFREMTAELGEELRERFGGRWTTQAGEGGVIEPVVEVAIGGEMRKLAPWQWVAELLDGGGADLGKVVEEALGPGARPSPASAPSHGTVDGGSPDSSPR